MNITLIGMPGAGKSYFGRKLADKLKYNFVDFDLIIEKEYKMTLPKVLDHLGDLEFIKKEGEVVIDGTKDKNSLIISPGGSIVYNQEAMKHLSSISKIIYLKSNLENIEKIVAKRPRGVVGLKNKSVSELYKERSIFYEKWAELTVDVHQTEEKVIDTILKFLK